MDDLKIIIAKSVYKYRGKIQGTVVGFVITCMIILYIF